MSHLPFSRIDPVRAREDLVALTLPLRGGKRKYLLSEAYCINLKCVCALAKAHLVPFGESLKDDLPLEKLMDLLSESWIRQPERVDLEFDLIENQLVVAETNPALPEWPEIAAVVEKAFKAWHVNLLQSHRDVVNAWKQENWWRYENWAGLELGELVPWRKVFPKPSPLLVEQEGKTYDFYDEYCINPECHCLQAHCAVYPITRSEKPIQSIGTLGIIWQSGRLQVDEVKAKNPALIEALFRTLRESRFGLQELLDHRYRFMKEFGAFVRERWPLKNPESSRREHGVAPTRVPGAEMPDGFFTRKEAGGSPIRSEATKVGRNNPCPCGSGRKYKRCCGSKDRSPGP